MKRFFRYTVPSIFAMWVFAFYTMADGYFVANYVGELEFSAVNISLPVITSFFALGILLSIGTQAKVGINLGKGNISAAREIFTTGFFSLAVLGIVYTVLAGFFLGDIISWLGAGKMTFSLVREYLGILVPFGVFFMITYQLETLVKVDGFPHFAAFSVFLAAAANLVLDYFFIVQLSLGLFGAGLATGLAQVLSTLLLLIHFFRRRGKLCFVKKAAFSHLKSLLSIGTGDSLSELAIGYTVFLFNTTLLRLLGQDGVIIYTVISYISIFVQVTMTGIAQGVAPLFSYDYGRGEFRRIRRSIAGGLAFITLLSLFFMAGTKCFSLPLTGVFLPDNPKLQGSAATALIQFSLSYIFAGYNVFLVTFFASLGRGRAAAFISLLRTPILITGVMLFYEKFIGGDFIWYVLAISEGLTTLIAGYLLLGQLRLLGWRRASGNFSFKSEG